MGIENRISEHIIPTGIGVSICYYCLADLLAAQHQSAVILSEWADSFFSSTQYGCVHVGTGDSLGRINIAE